VDLTTALLATLAVLGVPALVAGGVELVCVQNDRTRPVCIYVLSLMVCFVALLGLSPLWMGGY
jgi:hypothetical protein